LHCDNYQNFGIHGIEGLFLGLSTNQMLMNLCYLKQNRFFIYYMSFSSFGYSCIGVKLKTTKRKGLISYKIENCISAMKKHCEGEHSNIRKAYVSEISF
jgi:hypothetical protein